MANMYLYCGNNITMERCQQQGRIQAVVLWGRFQEWFLCKSHYWFTTVKEMKYASQRCYGKTEDGKMALYLVSQGSPDSSLRAKPSRRNRFILPVETFCQY